MTLRIEAHKIIQTLVHGIAILGAASGIFYRARIMSWTRNMIDIYSNKSFNLLSLDY